MKTALSIIAGVTLAWSLDCAPALASNAFPAVGHGDAHAATATSEMQGDTKVVGGPIAPARLNCNTRTERRSNGAEVIRFPGILSTGAALDNVASTHGSADASMRSTSTVHGVDALGGIVTATAVTAVANSTASTRGASSDANGSGFVDLVIAGRRISSDAAPNTIVTLPGFGSVEINEQKTARDETGTSIDVNMLHIRIGQPNLLGIKIGTDIIVGHAIARMDLSASPTGVDADAYGLLLKVRAGDDVRGDGGPYAPAAIACTAGTDRDRIVSIASPVGTTGAVLDLARGTVTKSGGMAAGHSRVERTNLLGGFITAGTIESAAEAQVSRTGWGSGAATFVHATIAGASVGLHPAPNTRVNLAHLGYAVLNEQLTVVTPTSAHIEVNAVHIFVTVANAFKLPIHSTIVIGHSAAEVAAF